MDDWLVRTRLLLGSKALEALSSARVAIFGVGGVGGFCVEALARAGVGALHLYDDDTVSESNLNRQLIALHSTIGRPKTQVMAERVLDINPNCAVKAIPMFYLPENADTVDLSQYDYVIDAIDTVAAKLDLVKRCTELNVPIICCSQLSRGPESRTDKRPMLSDLRESGSIEQDADTVIFLYRDEYYDAEARNEEGNIAEVIIAKNRHGAQGTVKVGWVGRFTKFRSIETNIEEG